jgi:hypothetical protein
MVRRIRWRLYADAAGQPFNDPLYFGLQVRDTLRLVRGAALQTPQEVPHDVHGLEQKIGNFGRHRQPSTSQLVE